MTDLIGEMRTAIHGAAGTNQKIAMFHFQVLKHAGELEGLDVPAVCTELGVPQTYQTEFRKMLSLARLMKEQGARLC
jgi:hypothetical protein